MTIIDLRSDTVTLPTPAMREAMYRAEVGDAGYGEDPTINRLEELAATITGKEAAMFVPSGTMGNCLSVLAHTCRGDEVILESESHIYFNEVAGMAALGSVQARTVPGRRGVLDPGQVEAAVRPQNVHFPRTSLLCVENTHNRGGGTVTPLATLAELYRVAHRNGMCVHMDGARVFNAATYLGVPVAEVVRHTDSVMFCLSKGLAAPVGSMVAGPAGWMAEARRYRKMLGGGMRQAGILAAAGLVALTTMTGRLHQDHELAKKLAVDLSRLPGIQVDLDAVQTNIIFVDVAAARKDAKSVCAALAEQGVRCNPAAATRIRLVTHKDIAAEDIDVAVEAFAKALS
ncbi:MAG TPA: low specificity L-threonine aldolase [Clostridiales bacterium UBA8153]|nr:low specificity L-threonine aldolase [Clostridiales bacterium UBA8153]